MASSSATQNVAFAQASSETAGSDNDQALTVVNAYDNGIINNDTTIDSDIGTDFQAYHFRRDSCASLARTMSVQEDEDHFHLRKPDPAKSVIFVVLLAGAIAGIVMFLEGFGITWFTIPCYLCAIALPYMVAIILCTMKCNNNDAIAPNSSNHLDHPADPQEIV